MLALGFSTAQFHSSYGAHREYNSHKVADTHNTKPLQIVVVVFHAKKPLNSLTSKLLAARVDGSSAASRGEVEASQCGRCCDNTTAATDHRGGTVRDTVCSTDVCRCALHSRSKRKKKEEIFHLLLQALKKLLMERMTDSCFCFIFSPSFNRLSYSNKRSAQINTRRGPYASLAAYVCANALTLQKKKIGFAGDFGFPHVFNDSSSSFITFS